MVGLEIQYLREMGRVRHGARARLVTRDDLLRRYFRAALW
jgi:hypothetical protein